MSLGRMFSVLLIGTFLLGTALAADDPIAQRRQLMQKVERLVGAANSVILGKFLPAKATSTLQKLDDSFSVLVTLFPEGSGTGNTNASPAIWSDPEGFKAIVAKIVADLKSAEAAIASGQDAFTLAWQAVHDDCTSCHTTFESNATM